MTKPGHDIRINVYPLADRTAEPDEKIIEFDTPYGDGLISFRLTGDGEVRCEPYRLDESVKVITPQDDNRTQMLNIADDILADDTSSDLTEHAVTLANLVRRAFGQP